MRHTISVTPKLILSGVQTAKVVGPGGEEIHADEHGRVKVQFHWDREGKNDDTSSVWMRVSQVHAGKKFGRFDLSRIGQEVIVDFVQGDPDRPIIVGRVHNDQQDPPYELPANKTRSGMKTRSSSEGGEANSNEIRFEDKAGFEEVFIQAEKDMNVVVDNDRSDLVRRDEVTEVTRDRTVLVGRDRTQTVVGDQSRHWPESNDVGVWR